MPGYEHFCIADIQVVRAKKTHIGPGLIWPGHSLNTVSSYQTLHGLMDL